MRKNDLIAMLSNIKGNPEIVLWNGIVGDFQHIDPTPVEGELVKQTLDHYIEMCRLEDCRDRKDWNYQLPASEVDALKVLYRKVCKWEINNWVCIDDIKANRYKKKRVVYLQAKLKNERFSDRAGNIEY